MPVKAHCFCWELRAVPNRACCCCGLLRLKNEASQKACKRPCPGKE